jgi:hypothetical protein
LKSRLLISQPGFSLVAVVEACDQSKRLQPA